MSIESKVHSSISGPKVAPLTGFDAKDYPQLKMIGIDIGNPQRMMAAMDAIQPSITVPSVGAPIQFLQSWLPGLVDIVTQARVIDEIVGIQTIGDWADEEIVQGTREFLNAPQLYGDYTNMPKASANINWEKRTIVRFEQGISVSTLDQERMAKTRVDLASSYRESAALGLEIVRNSVGFFGFNSGANFTYGFLNDPNLLPYNTVPATGTGTSTTWATKNFLQIVADLRQMISGLRTQSGANVDPEKVNLTLVLPTNVVDYLGVTSDFGNSVRDWLTETYPKIRVVSAPELNAANAGANVGYLFADAVPGTSTDGGQTFIQMVPAKFKVLGVQQMVKGYDEDFTNATAGVLCKRPVFVYRVTGI